MGEKTDEHKERSDQTGIETAKILNLSLRLTFPRLAVHPGSARASTENSTPALRFYDGMVDFKII
jgi:hypothetical protein